MDIGSVPGAVEVMDMTGLHPKHGGGPLDYEWVTYIWVTVLSFWGGLASYIRKVREGASRFNLMEIFGELVVSGFSGVMTFYVCEATGSPEVLTAVAVGISGHMGARIITMIENWVTNKIGLPKD